MSLRSNLLFSCDDLFKRSEETLAPAASAGDASSGRTPSSQRHLYGRADYNSLMGFEEISHTADWSVRVWAADLPSLFAESARAMNTLAGIVIAKRPRVKWRFESDGPDAESLLVSFLSELVYYQEQENMAFDVFHLEMDSQELRVEMEGAEIESVDKAIKAVTYHNLKIAKTNCGFETTIVFDV